MTNDLHAIERLRPEPVALDQEWSARVLRDIVDQPMQVTRRHTSRRRWALAGVAVATGLGSGMAYAGNGVPAWVQSSLNSFAGDQGHGDVDLVKIVEFTAPDGNRVAAWRGTAADGQVCEVLADNFTDEDKALASTYHCRPSADEALLARWTTVSRPFRVGEQADPDTTFAYVYGQFPDAERVAVIGPDFRRESPVDDKTGGYYVLLPHRTPGSTAEFVKFLDANGAVIRTVDLEDE